MWVAPNLITIVGLVINIVTSAVLVSNNYDRKFEGEKIAGVVLSKCLRATTLASYIGGCHWTFSLSGRQTSLILPTGSE